MATKIKIAQGNDVPLRAVMYAYNNGMIVEVPCVEVEDLKIYYGNSTFEKAVSNGNELPYTFSGSTLIFRLESSQIWKLQTYNIWIVGKWQGNDISYNYGSIIETVEFSAKSNVEEYINNDEVVLEPAIFIPPSLSREKIDELAREWERRVNDIDAGVIENAIRIALEASEKAEEAAEKTKDAIEKLDKFLDKTIVSTINGEEPDENGNIEIGCIDNETIDNLFN